MRTHYRNGDDITPQHGGCDGCNPSMIDGVLCHERGCPDAWRDYRRVCKWCGSEFTPESAGQEYCDDDCYRAYNNLTQ